MSSSLNSSLAVGDWPQQPAAFAETYIPDQLIAGGLKIVTANVTVGGNATLPRGTVLGQQTVGTATSSTGKTQGSQTITVAAVPTAGDTVTVDGTVVTFVAANPSGNQVLIGGPGPDGNPVPAPTIAGTANAFVDFLIASTDTNISKMTYSINGAVITATSIAYGTAGNAYTLATTDSGAFTLGGATLAGGTANTGAETIGSISPGPLMKRGVYNVVLTSSTAFNVFDPNGVGLAAGTVGTAYSDPQINFTVTTGGGIAAGDQFGISGVAPTNYWVQNTGGATDGSQNATAILADVATPTTGSPVTAGIYQMGEFNVNAMTFGPGTSIPAVTAALRALGIFVKPVQTAADPS
jgi:hypothetical protein